MKRGIRGMAIALAAVLLLGEGLQAQAAVEKQALPSGILYEEIGTEIETFVSEHEATTAGMSVSVFEAEDTIYSGYLGYADRETGLTMQEDTVVEWGSATKLLVWVSVMQLWEQGKINLETDIREYLPEDFLTNVRYDTPITMLHLMNHNAGFQEVYADLFVGEIEAVVSLEESLQAHMPEQIYEPGTVTAYSNWGVALAGYIVERVSGVSFADYVHQHIFEPLGMEHSAVSATLEDNIWVQQKRKELQCYTTDGVLLEDSFYYITLYPAGMCTSTLADFEAFGKALLNEEALLFQSRETWEMLFTPSAYLGDSDIPSNYHGFWMLPYGVETIGHGGNTAGCSSYLLLDLESGIGVVVMTNQSNESVYNMEMMELIFGKYVTEDYFPQGRENPEGIYRPARTVRSGPFKLMSLTYAFDFGEEEAEDFWATGSSGDVEKICFGYGDYVRIPVWEFVLELALVILWVVSLAFAVFSLLIKGIRKLVCICRKKKCEIPMGKWSAVAAFVQIGNILLLVWMAIQAFSYAVAGSYMWCFGVFGVLALVMLGLAVYGVCRLRKVSMTRKRRFYNVTTVVLLMSSFMNILYWNLFMGWRV